MISLSGMGLAAPFGGLKELRAALDTDVPSAPDHKYRVDTTSLTEFVPARRLRRVDHFTSMTLLAAYRALYDAGYGETLPERMGIVLCTGYGPSETTFDFLDSIIDFGAGCASPLAFSHSVHNIPAAMLAMFLKTPCPCTTLCQLHRPVFTGLLTAQTWLSEERVDTVLLGAVDETTPLLEHTSNQLGRNPVGEGAAFFVLQRQEERTGRTIRLAPAEAPKGLAAREVLQPKVLCGDMPVGAAFALAATAVRVEAGIAAECMEHGALIRVEQA